MAIFWTGSGSFQGCPFCGWNSKNMSEKHDCLEMKHEHVEQEKDSK